MSTSGALSLDFRVQSPTLSPDLPLRVEFTSGGVRLVAVGVHQGTWRSLNLPQRGAPLSDDPGDSVSFLVRSDSREMSAVIAAGTFLADSVCRPSAETETVAVARGYNETAKMQDPEGTPEHGTDLVLALRAVQCPIPSMPRNKRDFALVGEEYKALRAVADGLLQEARDQQERFTRFQPDKTHPLAGPVFHGYCVCGGSDLHFPHVFMVQGTYPSASLEGAFYTAKAMVAGRGEAQSHLRPSSSAMETSLQALCLYACTTRQQAPMTYVKGFLRPAATANPPEEPEDPTMCVGNVDTVLQIYYSLMKKRGKTRVEQMILYSLEGWEPIAIPTTLRGEYHKVIVWMPTEAVDARLFGKVPRPRSAECVLQDPTFGRVAALGILPREEDRTGFLNLSVGLVRRATQIAETGGHPPCVAFALPGEWLSEYGPTYFGDFAHRKIAGGKVCGSAAFVPPGANGDGFSSVPLADIPKCTLRPLTPCDPALMQNRLIVLHRWEPPPLAVVKGASVANPSTAPALAPNPSLLPVLLQSDVFRELGIRTAKRVGVSLWADYDYVMVWLSETELKQYT